MEFKDYYKILGVSSNDNADLIKTAYRKLSKKFHPDVNNGDNFFEEKFKEIQEAYEVLSDVKARKQYDYNRANNTNTNGRDYAEYLRKKEEEFAKQNEKFKKWEDSLRTKEEALRRKAKNKKAWPVYLVLIVCLVGLSIIWIYFEIYKKQTQDRTTNSANVRVESSKPLTTGNNTDKLEESLLEAKVVNGKTYQKDANGYWQEIEAIKKGVDYSTNDNELVLQFRNSTSGKLLDGKWAGSAFQYDTKESWSIRFNCDAKEGVFIIEYPSLGCSGSLYLEELSNDNIVFRENIQNGSGVCVNGGKVVLRSITNKKIEYVYYLPYSVRINAKGMILKK